LSETGGTSAIRTAAGTLVTVLRNRDIRSLELAWTLGIAADWAVLVVALLVAYDVGGPVLVGFVSLIRMVPATLINLFVDPGRFARAERVLVWVNLARSFAASGVAVAILFDVPLLVFAGLALEAGVAALVRPTMMAILPAVARTPDELVSANVTNALGEATGTFLGPLAAGIAIARSGPAPAAALAAAICVVAALAAWRVHVADAARPPQAERPKGIPIRTGLRELARHRQAFVVTGSLWAQVGVRGMLTTYLAVLSLGVLGMGDEGVGLLGAAIGLGGLVGAFIALALGARRGLAPVHVIALVLWGAPIAVIGVVTTPAVALLALGIVGVGNALVDVAGYTLLQRGIPNRWRMAVFSVFEVGVGIALSLGGLLGAVLVGQLGIEQALIVTGLILPVAAVLSWASARRLDEAALVSGERAAILRAVPLFRPLPLAALERLADGMHPVHYDAGARVMTQGEWGDEYVIVGSGSLEISVDGTVLTRLGPGDGCGEIGLLRSTPRTATVDAIAPVDGWAIECPTFVAVVTGQDESRVAAEMVIAERLRRGGTLPA
jgi:MFS family permease